MPSLDEIEYSHDATVAAVRDYYRFLVSMYMDESNIAEPPEGGWPSIRAWNNFDKTDAVIELLRHLPYIRMKTESEQALGAPYCEFCDWENTPQDIDGSDLKEWSEPDLSDTTVPAHIVGLAVHSEDTPLILLDTELGVVYWYGCRGEVKQDSIGEVEDDPYDWVDDGIIPEDQVEWRSGSGIWAIKDFFELLKLQFKKLNFVPIGPRRVLDVWVAGGSERTELLVATQKIYRKHGWPDTARFRKEDCLSEVRSMLEARIPGDVNLWF